MAMVGLRNVLVYAENESKTVTVSAGSVTVTGVVRRVNPLIVQPPEGDTVVLDIDTIYAVSVKDAGTDDLVNACKPERETKFLGSNKF